jgi:predicted RNA-binding Zn-ribbon protein involved in translation (DUF1610 family)
MSPEIVHVYYCPVCKFETEVVIRTPYTCPMCGNKMTYRTSRPRK